MYNAWQAQFLTYLSVIYWISLRAKCRDPRISQMCPCVQGCSHPPAISWERDIFLVQDSKFVINMRKEGCNFYLLCL